MIKYIVLFLICSSFFLAGQDNHFISMEDSLFGENVTLLKSSLALKVDYFFLHNLNDFNKNNEVAGLTIRRASDIFNFYPKVRYVFTDISIGAVLNHSKVEVYQYLIFDIGLNLNLFKGKFKNYLPSFSIGIGIAKNKSSTNGIRTPSLFYRIQPFFETFMYRDVLSLIIGGRLSYYPYQVRPVIETQFYMSYGLSFVYYFRKSDSK